MKGEKHGDFMEMLLHHAATFCLIISMIAANNMPCGCVILFLHDIADVPVSLVKLSTCFSRKFSLFFDMTFFTTMFVSWAWTRIGVLQYFTYELMQNTAYLAPEWQ